MDKEIEKTPARPGREPLDKTIPEPRFPVPLPSPKSPGRNLSKLFKNSDLMMNDQVNFHQGPRSRRRGHQLAVWSLLAAFIDTLIMISISCIFLVAFSAVIKDTLGFIVAEFEMISSLQQLFVGVFILSSWIYMITLRVFLGASIGEWACDLRLGQAQERMKVGYILQVLFRETLVVATGLVTLPLLSLIFGKDISGKISGIRLFSLK